MLAGKTALPAAFMAICFFEGFPYLLNIWENSNL